MNEVLEVFIVTGLVVTGVCLWLTVRALRQIAPGHKEGDDE